MVKLYHGDIFLYCFHYIWSGEESHSSHDFWQWKHCVSIDPVAQEISLVVTDTTFLLIWLVISQDNAPEVCRNLLTSILCVLLLIC